MKADIGELAGYVVLAPLMFCVVLTFSLFMIGIYNDNIMYEIYSVASDLDATGQISPEVIPSLESANQGFLEFIATLDNLWFLSYVMFVIVTISASYFVRRMNEAEFLSFLFFGTLIILFMLTIYSAIALWFDVNILSNLYPNYSTILVKFAHYINHIGIYSLVHLLAMIILNRIDLGVARGYSDKEDSELL